MEKIMARVDVSAAVVLRNQQHAILITIVVTALAAALGLLFAILVSGGITRPVRLLLEGTREIEAGHLDRSIEVITRDEIGQLSAAFNRMVSVGAIVWDGIAQNVVGRPKRIARSSVVTIVSIAAVKVWVFRARRIPTGGWATLGTCRHLFHRAFD